MKISRKALLLLLVPALLGACAVRQLNDGSYTSCAVGNPCQVGPRSPMVRPTSGPMLHHHHHHMVKKTPQGKVVVPVTPKKVPASERGNDSGQ